jgi:hypothetical protein
MGRSKKRERYRGGRTDQSTVSSQLRYIEKRLRILTFKFKMKICKVSPVCVGGT